MTAAQERIAKANRIDAATNGRPTAHCDDCGRLVCECDFATLVERLRARIGA